MASLLAVDLLQILIFLFVIISSIGGQIYKSWQESQKVARRNANKKKKAIGEGMNRDKADSPVTREVKDFVQRRTPDRAERQPMQASETPVIAKVKPRKQTPPKRDKQQRDFATGSQMARIGQTDRDQSPRSSTSHAARWSSSIEMADEKIESHLHSVFDRKLGSFESARPFTPISEGTDMTRPATGNSQLSADEISQMLQSPQSLATAIVLGEILHRPTDRWE